MEYFPLGSAEQYYSSKAILRRGHFALRDRPDVMEPASVEVSLKCIIVFNDVFLPESRRIFLHYYP